MFLYSFGKRKPLGIIIHQKEAAESYDEFFEMLWKAGKK